MGQEKEAFTLDEWIATQLVDYTVPDEVYEEVKALLEPAVAKCRELNIPFTFSIQTALRSSDSGAGIGGTSYVCNEPERVGPDALLSRLLFMRTNPQEALAMVSWAMQQKMEQATPTIFVP